VANANKGIKTKLFFLHIKILSTVQSKKKQPTKQTNL